MLRQRRYRYRDKCRSTMMVVVKQVVVDGGETLSSHRHDPSTTDAPNPQRGGEKAIDHLDPKKSSHQ